MARTSASAVQSTMQVKIQDEKYKMKNTKYKIQNTKYEIRNKKRKIQNTKLKINGLNTLLIAMARTSASAVNSAGLPRAPHRPAASH